MTVQAGEFGWGGQKNGAVQAQPGPQDDDVFTHALSVVFQSYRHSPGQGPSVVNVVVVGVGPSVVVVEVPMTHGG